MPLAESLFGWYVGLTVAFVLIVVVVAVVASILTLAQHIAEQAPLAAEGLGAVAENTSSIPAIETVNATAVNILKDCQAARAALGGVMSLTVPALAVLGYTAQELTMWRITLGIGAVVIAVVILLLSFLVKIVKDIDGGVAEVLAAAGAVAANTASLEGLMVTNDAVAELKEEALRHAALVEAL